MSAELHFKCTLELRARKRARSHPRQVRREGGEETRQRGHEHAGLPPDDVPVRYRPAGGPAHGMKLPRHRTGRVERVGGGAK